MLKQMETPCISLFSMSNVNHHSLLDAHQPQASMEQMLGVFASVCYFQEKSKRTGQNRENREAPAGTVGQRNVTSFKRLSMAVQLRWQRQTVAPSLAHYVVMPRN